jgi:hypothetical protein
MKSQFAYQKSIDSLRLTANRFILDHTFVDFTDSLLILGFDIVDFNSKMIKSTVKP